MKKFFTFFIVLILSLIKPVISKAQVISSDSLALVGLYTSTSGASAWTNTSGWLSGQVNDWYGVTVTGNRVTEINLSSNNLQGSLSSTIGDLTALTSLDLSTNQIGGSIPSAIGNLTNLAALTFASNQLSGSIPTTIGNLTNLAFLDLSNNQLTATLPYQLGNLVNVGGLFLYNNQLSGSIPGSLGKMSSLYDLELNNNQLSGSIPDSLQMLTILDYLDIADNQLSGSIPTWFGSLFSLNELHLNNNQLTGTIPASLGTLSNLNFLILSFNQLSGSIPPSINDLSKLRGFNVSNNQLTGTIPASLGKSNIFFVDLSFNLLTDTIPASFANLTSASTSVNNNKLTFEGQEVLFPTLAGIIIDSPQALIPLQLAGSIFSVSAGGTLANNTYSWYKNGVLQATVTGDSTYTATTSGSYTVTVSNSVVTPFTGLKLNSVGRTFGVVLPVTFLDFTGVSADDRSLLQWHTGTEVNTSYFNIQRSTDGANYISIGKVNAAGHSNTTTSYNYTDDVSTLSGNSIIYYRLQEIDKDGNSSYSNIVPIQLSASASFTIYPNPVKDVLHIRSGNNSGNAIISIYDANGNKLLTQQQTVLQNNTTSINAANFAQGAYFVQIILNGTSVLKKFVKE